MCLSGVSNLLRNPRSFHSGMVKETSVEWHCLHGVAASKKTDNLSTSTDSHRLNRLQFTGPSSLSAFFLTFVLCLMFKMISSDSRTERMSGSL